MSKDASIETRDVSVDPIILMLMRQFLVEELAALEREREMRYERLLLANALYDKYRGCMYKLRVRGCIAHRNHVKQLCASAKRDLQNIICLERNEQKRYRISRNGREFNKQCADITIHLPRGSF